MAVRLGAPLAQVMATGEDDVLIDAPAVGISYTGRSQDRKSKY